MATVPPKALKGEKCNGCGLCCAAWPCILAREFVGATSGPCPALEFEGGRFWCGLLRAPHRYLGTFPEGDYLLQPAFAFLLGAGLGCDSDDDPPIAEYRARETAMTQLSE